MSNNNQQQFQQFYEFIRILNRKDKQYEEVVSDAIAFLADDLFIGRLTGELEILPDAANPSGVQEKTVFYTSEKGFTAEDPYVLVNPIMKPGSVTLTAFHRPNQPFQPEQRLAIQAVLELINMVAERNFMILTAERQGMMQMLTGLPNAVGYMKEVGKKYRDRTITDYDAYYFNLTGYGLINKNFGQTEGDEIMKRYTGIIRSFLEPEELLGHLGGDNFIALIRKGDRSLQFQKRIRQVDTYGMQYGKQIPLSIRACAGFMHIERATPPEQIISGPAAAGGFARRSKETIVLLDEALNDRLSRAKEIEQGFEKALANHEYTVFYQPKVDAATGALIGAEALTRWFKGDRMVSPGLFIPILEQSSRITVLDLSMLELVCHDIADWKAAGENVVPVSVNISRHDLMDPELFQKVAAILDRYQIARNDIVIEITETSNEAEKEQMIAFLTQLKEHGIAASIDDFGTGYSSLSILREFPVSEIKLDRSFINKELGEKDAIIIRMIIQLAKELKIEVIQEGVETEEQRDFIMKLGCHRIQGFLYSQPLPKSNYDLWLKQGRKPE